MLSGFVLSIVLSHSWVSIGGFTSNTIVALFLISVPVASPFLVCTIKTTCPSPSGGVTFGGAEYDEGWFLPQADEWQMNA